MSARPAAQRLQRAERKAKEARAKLSDTLNELQHAMSPANLLTEAIQEIRSRGQGFAGQTLGKFLSRPVAATAVASAIGLVIKRKPVISLLLKLLLPGGATSRRAKHSTPDRARRSAAPVREKETDDG